MNDDEKSKKLYSIIWGQCTGALKTKLRTLRNFEDIKDSQDSI